MSKNRLLIFLIFFIATVFYYSWIPDSSFNKETYLPLWLLDWSNHHYNLRTAIPFLAIGFLLEAYMQNISSIEIRKNMNLSLIQNTAIATIIICLAEGGQFLIQKRNPDLSDVFYGILGSLIGGLGYYFFNKVYSYKIVRNAK
jgi:glycopeptide antibiotics resistance protein